MAEDPDRTTAVELPPAVIRRILDAGQDVAHATEAALTPVASYAYREGWVNGYLARHHEITQEQP